MKAKREQLAALPDGDTNQKNVKLNAACNRVDDDAGARKAPYRPRRDSYRPVAQLNRIACGCGACAMAMLVIPKKPRLVMVNGQVFNATALATPGRNAKWYLSQAGGSTPIADKKGVFVIRADGSVISSKNNSDGWWAGDP